MLLKFGTATRSVTQRCSITTWLVHHGPGISQNFSQFAKQPIEFKDFRVFKVICYFLLLREHLCWSPEGITENYGRDSLGTHHGRHLRLPALCTESREALCPLLWWSPVLKHMQYNRYLEDVLNIVNRHRHKKYIHTNIYMDLFYIILYIISHDYLYT